MENSVSLDKRGGFGAWRSHLSIRIRFGDNLENRYTNKLVLKNSQYKNDKHLLIRKRYNSFLVPKQHLNDSIIKIIKRYKPARVLDVGCGNGDLLIKARKRGVNAVLFGIDISKGMLRSGVKQDRKQRLKIRFAVEDAENLKFGNNYFDTIIFKHVLFHLPNPQKGIDEAYRCLRSGGILVITLNSKYDQPKFRKFEGIISKRYNLSVTHGPNSVNMENIRTLLKRFRILRIEKTGGTIKKPRMFPLIIDGWRDMYNPQPSDGLWKKIIVDAKNFVDIETKKGGEFRERKRGGIIIAQKD